MWEWFLSIFVNALLILYRFLGQQTIIAVTVLTVIVRLAMMPLTLKQQRSAQRMQELQPELKKIQEKYAKDREKLAQEQMRLYQEAGMNPLGGCLPTLLQFPLFIGLLQAITRVMASTPPELLRLSQNIWSFLPGMTNLVPLQSRFLWLDIAQPDPYLILPILVVLTSWIAQKIMTPPATDQRSAAMNQQMMIMMPLMFGFFALSYASGLSIYFIISNLITILQYYLARRDTLGSGKGTSLATRVKQVFSRQ
jgi:YidC/Oxa1 family membrane protein insertase